MSRRFLYSRLWLACVGLALWVGSAGDLRAEEEMEGPSTLASIASAVRHIYANAREAVVKVEAEDHHGRLSGTGFFIDPRGTIYTSYSVGGESEDIVVLMGERKYPAKRLLGDPRGGIAILKIEANTPFLPVGKSSALSVADPVVVIGYPMDLPVTPSLGVVAGFDLKYLGRYFSTTHIRANVSVQRGQGGSPLLNMNGEVVGILISSLDGRAGCFALPMEAAEKVRRDLVRFGEVRPGWLGIDVAEAREESQGSVAQIKDVIQDAPAASSELKRGDVLLKVGAVEIKGPEDVLNAAFFLSAGEMVSIVVARGPETVTVNVRAGTATAPGGNPLRMTSSPATARQGMEFKSD